MWPRLHPHPQHTALAFFFCMSLTRLLSECQMLYDWKYDDDDTATNTEFQIGKLPDFPLYAPSNELLGFSFGDPEAPAASNMEPEQPEEMASPWGEPQRPNSNSEASDPERQNLQEGLLLGPEHSDLHEDLSVGPEHQDLHEDLTAGPEHAGLEQHQKQRGHTGYKGRKGRYGDRLSPEEALALREKLKGLYALLKKHPALMDRRLQVGSKKPHIPPDHQDVHIETKRSFTHLNSRAVCPSRSEWRMLHAARDINGTQVEVFQPSHDHNGRQWFYTITCDHRARMGPADHHSANSLPRDCPRCCYGINAHRFHSRCLTKKTLVMALIRKHHEHHYDWNWIQVDSGCSCSISPV